MRVLVTGGAGFIGSNLADKLIEHGFQVVILDNLSSGSRSNIEHLLNMRQATFIEEDVLNIHLCAEKIGRIDLIVHLSALVSVQESIDDPHKSLLNNAVATSAVFEFARKLQVGGVIYASSAAVYGSNTAVPISEIARMQPLSPYAADKAYAEHLGSVYWNSFGLSSIGLRFFNVYGPRQNPQSPYTGVISKFIDACLNDVQLKIYGDGNQTRDFVYVEDLANAVISASIRLLDKECGVNCAVLNIGSGESVTIQSLAKLVRIACGKPHLGVKFDDKRQGEVRHSLANIAMSQELIGWAPSTKLERGLQKTIEHLLTIT